MRASSRHGSRTGSKSEGWSAIGRCRPGESVGPFRLDTNTGCMDLGLGQLIGVLHFWSSTRQTRYGVNLFKKRRQYRAGHNSPIYRGNHYAREESVTRDSYSYNRRMSGGSPAVFQSVLEGVALGLSYILVSRINFLGSSDSRRRIREDYWKAADLYRAVELAVED